MTKHYVVTDIKIIEPVEGEFTLEELEGFKKQVEEVICNMVLDECTVEVVVSYGIDNEEDVVENDETVKES